MNTISDAPADWLEWDSYAELSTADVAERLGITEAGVATAQRRHPDFPAAISASHSGPNARWSAAEIYDYQLATVGRPRRRPLPVPRLHPRAGTTAPTLFETVTLRYDDPITGIAFRWIAHVIKTSDGADPIVLAFRIDSTPALPAECELDAIELASDGYVPRNSTFVLAQDTCDAAIPRPRRAPAARTRRHGHAAPPAHHELLDPRIRVLDQDMYWRAHWTDLAAALPGFPLPWWPPEFRYPGWMRMWRAGDPPRRLTLRPSRRPLPSPVNFRELSDEAGDALFRASLDRPDYSYLDRLVPQAHPVVTITYPATSNTEDGQPTDLAGSGCVEIPNIDRAPLA